jgi:predicted DNA-binding protein (UPF0251 family)
MGTANEDLVWARRKVAELLQHLKALIARGERL